MRVDVRMFEPKGTIITIIRPNNNEVIDPLKHVRFDIADLLNLDEAKLMTDRHRWKLLVDMNDKNFVFKYHSKIRLFRYDTGMANSNASDYSYMQSGFPFVLNNEEEINIKKEIYNLIKLNRFRKEDSKESIPKYVLDNIALRELSKNILFARRKKYYK